MQLFDFLKVRVLIFIVFGVVFWGFADKHNDPSIDKGLDVRMINGVSVPSDFPTIETNVYGETAPGKVFCASSYTSVGNYLFILENDGTPYYYKKLPKTSTGGSSMFQMQPTGDLSFFHIDNNSSQNDVDRNFYIVMNSNFEFVDTLACVNGYRTNEHELLMLKNGNHVLIGDDWRTFDMSTIVEGGQPDARVLGNVIQEIDPNGNAVFEWNSFDYFNFTDALNVDLTGQTIDYVHTNSVAIDYDGNFIISNRNLSEVTKINRQTGAIMWRLGGVNNQFTFVDEPFQFSYQHDARPVSGKPGFYTIYDNGRYRPEFGEYTRLVEYELDTATMTATKVWDHVESYMDKIGWYGNLQRLANGNTFASWATRPPLYAFEVTSENEKVFDLSIQETSNYRVCRYEFEGKALKPYLLLEKNNSTVTLIFNKFGDDKVDHYKVYSGRNYNDLSLVKSSSKPYALMSSFQSGGVWYFRVSAVDAFGTESPLSNMVSAYIEKQTEPENMVINSDFAEGQAPWKFIVKNNAKASSIVDSDGHYRVDINQAGHQSSDIQVLQHNIELFEGSTYKFSFDCYAQQITHLNAKIKSRTNPQLVYGYVAANLVFKTFDKVEFEFFMDYPTDDDAEIVFECGNSKSKIFIDNVQLCETSTAKIYNSHLTDITSHESPAEFSLAQNYPNPFNGTTTISYSIPQNDLVSLNLFNVNGQLIENVEQSYKKAGSYSVTVSSDNLPSGIYFYTINAGSFSDTKKMTLLK